MVCSLTAAGVGLNLQVASNIVLAELSWTDAEQTQAIDRIHRIGQEEPVTAWRIIAAQTIDSRIAELIDSKAGLAARALDGSDEEVVVGRRPARGAGGPALGGPRGTRPLTRRPLGVGPASACVRPSGYGTRVSTTREALGRDARSGSAPLRIARSGPGWGTTCATSATSTSRRCARWSGARAWPW